MVSLFKDIITREAHAVIHFSDVFSPPEKDFDAELTAIIRNFGTLSDKTYYVGGNVNLAGYGSVLLNNLIEERKKISKEVDLSDPYAKTTLFCILNALPREGYRIENAPNGRDFHVAVTTGGVVVFGTPLSTLSALETRNEILALYRIPNENIPFTDGKKEQFRSSIIALSRFRAEEVMVPIYEYENIGELLEAKKTGAHTSPIKEQERGIEFAFSDRFKNVRLSVRDSRALRELLASHKGKEVEIVVDGEFAFSALYVNSLSETPIGKIGLYENIADAPLEYSQSVYWELIKRSDHCLDDNKMALDILQERTSDLNNAVIDIRAREEL